MKGLFSNGLIIGVTKGYCNFNFFLLANKFQQNPYKFFYSQVHGGLCNYRPQVGIGSKLFMFIT
jgi:hypothetical protein